MSDKEQIIINEKIIDKLHNRLKEFISEEDISELYKETKEIDFDYEFFNINCKKCGSKEIEVLYEFNYEESNFGLKCPKCNSQEYLIKYE